MKITKFSELPVDGFAGVRMREVVKDRRWFDSPSSSNNANGIGSLIYLADAEFIPHGDTRMHPHVEIDIVTIVLKGRLLHRGSLRSGQVLNAYDVLIQRAGVGGFMHNEVNPDPERNHVLQIWLVPEQPDLEMDYRLYAAKQNGITRVYGGYQNQREVLPAKTSVDIARLDAGEVLAPEGLTQIYVVEGCVHINDIEAEPGDYLETTNPYCITRSKCLLIVICLSLVASVWDAPQTEITEDGCAPAS